MELTLHSACHVTLRLSWDRKVTYCFRKSPMPVPILSQMNPVSAPEFYFPEIRLILPSHLRLRVPSGLFLSGFLTKILFALLTARATFPSHLIPNSVKNEH